MSVIRSYISKISEKDIEASGQLADDNQQSSPIFNIRISKLDKEENFRYEEISECDSFEDVLQLIKPTKAKPFFKCPKCTGNKDKNCKDCSGRGYVDQTHPLAVLLGKVITKKIIKSEDNVHNKSKKVNEARKSNYTLTLNNDIIKEQNSIFEDNNLCSKCCMECDSTYKFCEQCEDYYMCMHCYEEYSDEHPHHLITKCKSISENESFGRNHDFGSHYNDSDSQINKTQRESVNPFDDFKKVETIRCDNCSSLIDLCYEFCKDCLLDKIKYRICAKCANAKDYDHYPGHEFEMKMIGSQEEEVEVEVESISPPLHRENSQMKVKRMDTANSLVFINIANNSISDHQQLEDSNEFYTLQRNNIDGIICNQILQNNFEKNNTESDHIQSDFMTDLVEIPLKSKLSNSYNNDRQQKKEMTNKSQNQIFKTAIPQGLQKTKTTQEKYPNSKTSINKNPEEYFFNDYVCDICENQPIKNVRFHCKTCEDYDLCEQCYNGGDNVHYHNQFEEVNGLQIARKKRMELRGKSFQNIKKSILPNLFQSLKWKIDSQS